MDQGETNPLRQLSGKVVEVPLVDSRFDLLASGGRAASQLAALIPLGGYLRNQL